MKWSLEHEKRSGGISVPYPTCGSYVRSSQWFVFQTHPNCEEKAEQNVEKLGFRVLMPRMVDEFLASTEQLPDPLAMLFPGYGFVRFHAILDRWEPIRYQPGIRKIFLTPDQFPLAVPIAEMRALIRVCLNRRVGTDQRPVIRPGAIIRIRSGVMRGKLLTVESLPSASRVAVMMDMLGANREVTFNIDDVSLVE